ncbi:hypothetical protein ACI7BZ_09555 [Xanthobacter sp. AM11]|uniref:hypothetical protein n=1 Tax=Xanthobacter sp. AM11 TaxID=3380643 RepID=UPI0039BF8968
MSVRMILLPLFVHMALVRALVLALRSLRAEGARAEGARAEASLDLASLAVLA